MDDELKRYYRESLGARITALEEAAETLPGDPESAESVRRIAHTLKGSGGTYGFPDVSEAAAAVEDAAEAELADRLRHLLEVLRATADGSAPEASQVLVIEDDPDIRRVLEQGLAAPARRVLFAGTVAEARQVLSEEDVSVIVLDLVLPDADGRTFLSRLREQPDTAALPVIVLSAKSGPRTQAECFALGADDYFEKPFDPRVVAASVTARIRRSAELRRQSSRDDVTGLANRAALKQSYLSAQAEAQAKEEEEPLAVALLDFDRFKEVNDRFGHAAGDEALREAGRILDTELSEGTQIARWAGEDFVVLFRGIPVQAAKKELEAALGVLRKREMTSDEGDRFTLAFSAGVVGAPPGAPLEEVLARADHLLYVAKARGRGRVLTESEDIHAPATIVLCEDDGVTAALIKHRLGREGFDVRHFSDGRDAFEWAKEGGTADLVVLDVKMPGMDGFEVLGRLREITTFEDTPLLMLTSMGSERDVVRGFDLGADDYIVKPFSPVELVARIHRHLKRP